MRPSRSRTTTSSSRSRRRCSRPSRLTARTRRRELDEERKALSGKLGENIVVAGAARFEAVDGALIEGYAHPPANKLGVLVQVRGGSDDIARKIAMHIAASSPQWVGRDDVPEDVVKSEREIFANSDEVLSKPEQAREKIVEGMLNKRFFADRVLTEQPWIHDTGEDRGPGALGGKCRGVGVRAVRADGMTVQPEEAIAEADERQSRLSAHPAQALGGVAHGRPGVRHDVKELRDKTGAPMMDVKRALVDTNGDMDAAQRLLRERGMASAEKRAGRATTEGKVGYRIGDDAKQGTMVAVGCETEPVSNNDEFLEFAKKVLEAVEADGPDAAEQLDEERKALSGKLGENIVVAGAARFEAVNGALIEGYAHPPANKLGVLVQVRGGSGDIARKIAMHIAASSPQWVGREDVPEDVVKSEREIFANSDEVLSKPEQAREKIVEGMLNKRFFADRVLTEQPWIHDTGKTVGQALSEESAEVLEFERFALTG